MKRSRILLTTESPLLLIGIGAMVIELFFCGMFAEWYMLVGRHIN